MNKLILFLIVIFSFSLTSFAQDSTQTKQRKRVDYQKKEQVKTKDQVKEQKREHKFIDENGDGINDLAEENFHKMIRNKSKHHQKMNKGQSLENSQKTKVKKGKRGKGK